MNNKVKVSLLGFVFLCAVISSVFAAYSTTSAETENEIINSEAVGSRSSYLLRDFEGLVAVYMENEPDVPMTITSIEVSTLREYDQMLLKTGMKVETHERLVMILEDLGS